MIERLTHGGWLASLRATSVIRSFRHRTHWVEFALMVAFLFSSIACGFSAATTTFVTNATLNGIPIFSDNDIVNGLASTNAPIFVSGPTVSLAFDAFCPSGSRYEILQVNATDSGDSTATLTPPELGRLFFQNYSFYAGGSATDAIRTTFEIDVAGPGIWSGVLDFRGAYPLDVLAYSAFGTSPTESAPSFRLTLNVVPEPSVTVMLLLACASMLRRRHRHAALQSPQQTTPL